MSTSVDGMNEPLWLPGAHTVLSFIAARLPWLWGGEEHLRLALLGSLCGSFGVSVCMLLLWRFVLAPAIPMYKSRSYSDKVFLTNSFVSLWPAITAPVLAWKAMRRLPWDDVSQLMIASADEYALRAVGLSCGYMLYDTLYCLWYRPLRSPLIIGHHVLPVLFWPYSALNDRALGIVLFFVSTEVTNFGQHLRMMLLKLGLEENPLYKMIGVAWVALFFGVRILPSPYLFYHLVNGAYSEYSPAEFWCVFFLTPLPFMLNSYWFYLLFTGVIKFLNKANLTPAQRERLRKHA